MDKILSLVKKYKEIILYLLMGVLSTIVNIVAFEASMRILHIEALIANIIAWIVAVLFAYFTNRNFVFDKTGESPIREAAKFFTGRIGTLLMEEGLLWIMIYAMSIHSSIAKIIAQVFVVVANYIISKLFVFKKNKR